MEVIAEIFRNNLKQVLEEPGQPSQAELARKIGISPSYLNDLIHGRTNGSEKVRRAIAAALGYSYENFLALGRRLLSGESPNQAEVCDIAVSLDPKVVNALKSHPTIEKIVTILGQMTEEDIRDIKEKSEEKLRIREMEKKLKRLEGKAKKAG